MHQGLIWLPRPAQLGLHELLFGFLHLQEIQNLGMHEVCLVACMQTGLVTKLQLWYSYHQLVQQCSNKITWV